MFRFPAILVLYSDGSWVEACVSPDFHSSQVNAVNSHRLLFPGLYPVLITSTRRLQDFNHPSDFLTTELKNLQHSIAEWHLCP